jgi:hypothetical protein
MKIKFMSVILLMMLILTSSGCSGTWRRKFVRARKGESKEGPVLQPHDYKREFTNRQLYANNYVFWKSAQSELIKSVKSKDNVKRIISQAGYALVAMKKMESLLVDEKRLQLETYIAELEEIIEKIEQPNYVSSNSNILASRLSKHYRAVNRNFSFRRMKNFIKPDEHEEGSGNDNQE